MIQTEGEFTSGWYNQTRFHRAMESELPFEKHTDFEKAEYRAGQEYTGGKVSTCPGCRRTLRSMLTSGLLKCWNDPEQGGGGWSIWMTETRLQNIWTGWKDKLNLTSRKWAGLNVPFCTWSLRGKAFITKAVYVKKALVFLLHVSFIWINSIASIRIEHDWIIPPPKYRMPYHSFQIHIFLLMP